MAYLTTDQLKPELGHPQANVVWGQGVFPATTRVDEIIAGNSRIIDGMCRGRYTVPFSPVPAEITRICLSLCLADLLPTIHRNVAEQHERAARERKWAMDLLDRIQKGAYSLEDGDDASTMVSGGPVIVAATATERIFSVEDYH